MAEASLGRVKGCKHHHAVAIPVPAQGHMNSLMRFCTKLAVQGGFTITFVDIDPIRGRLEELNQQSQQATAAEHTAPLPVDIRRARIPIQDLDLNNDFRFSLEHFSEAMKTLTPAIEDLLLTLLPQDPPVTCLVSDFFMTSATHDVALKFNLPRIVFYPWSQSLLLLTKYMLEDVVSQEEAVKVVQGGEKGLFKEGLPGLPQRIHNEDLLLFKHLDEENAYMYEYTIKELENSIKGSGCHSIVVNSFQEAESAAFEVLKAQLKVPVYPVGPLREALQKKSATSLWEDDESCITWLDKQPALSVLYVSFGSITLFSHPQFEELVAGLLSSQQRFLFVFRPDLIENTPYTTFPSHLLLASNGKGYATNWAPQLRILAHSSVGGFLTHCGLNSVMEALGHGVPMLCWPYFADQFMNTKYVVEEWKVGLRFVRDDTKQGQTTRSEVERVVRAFMEGEEGKGLRKNATSLLEVSRRSLLAGGTSYMHMEALIQSL